MNIQANNNPVLGSVPVEGRMPDTTKETGKKEARKAVFGGNFAQNCNPVEARKEQAKKQAMQLWKDAVSAEQKIDRDLDEREEHVEKLRAVIDEMQGHISRLSDKQEELKELYGVKPDSDMPLPQEYLERYRELEEAKGVYLETQHKAKKEFLAESEAIDTIKDSRVKSHALVDAQKQKDDAMIKISEDAAQMRLQEVKDKVDEEQEKQEEKAREKAEKEEIAEELREAIREKVHGEKEYEEEEDSLVIMQTEAFAKLDNIKDEVQQEVEKMANDMKILVEELKGAAVDEIV